MRFPSRKLRWILLFVLIAPGSASPQALSGVLPATSTIQDPVMGTYSGVSSLPASSRSYILGSVHISAGAENNPSLISSESSQISAVANVFGDFSLRKYWRHLGTSIDYTGGDTLYRSYGDLKFDNQQFQRLSADEAIRWTSGQLSVRDMFSYTGSRAFGAFSPAGIGSPTNPGSQFFGATLFAPSFASNVAVASIAQSLTKRTSANFSAAYAFTDYLSNSEGLFNSRQASTQAGISHEISRKNSIGVLYGYQDFQFIPDVQSVVTNSAQLVFQRHLTDRMNLVLGAGPDRIVTSGITTKTQINAIIQASLAYRLKKSYLNLSYNRLVTAGSGVYAGGISDTSLISVQRAFTRSWQAELRGGYDRTTGLGVSSFGAQLPESRYWFTGLTVHRRLGRSLSAFASYEFNYDSFLSCGGFQGCGPAVNRNILLTGLDWSIRPIHLE